ncbi:hypothetical protein ACMFMG_005524 [Clarireedia jacksonii]
MNKTVEEACMSIQRCVPSLWQGSHLLSLHQRCITLKLDLITSACIEEVKVDCALSGSDFRVFLGSGRDKRNELLYELLSHSLQILVLIIESYQLVEEILGQLPALLSKKKTVCPGLRELGIYYHPDENSAARLEHLAKECKGMGSVFHLRVAADYDGAYSPPSSSEVSWWKRQETLTI